METIAFKFTGVSPLLMHSVRGADPFDPLSKELKKLTSTRKKTEEVHEQVARTEWELGLYHDPKMGPYVPTTNLRAAIVEGAKLSKLGTTLQRATVVLSEKAPLQYEGPRDVQGLWDAGTYRDLRAVTVGQAKVMRCRPVFAEWSVSFELAFDPSVVQREAIIDAARAAGRLIGLCDFRPNCGGAFGRFEVQVP